MRSKVEICRRYLQSAKRRRVDIEEAIRWAVDEIGLEPSFVEVTPEQKAMRIWRGALKTQTAAGVAFGREIDGQFVVQRGDSGEVAIEAEEADRILLGFDQKELNIQDARELHRRVFREAGVKLARRPRVIYRQVKSA